MDVVKKLINFNDEIKAKNHKAVVIVSAYNYSRLSAYAFIIKIKGDTYTKVVPVAGKFSSLVSAGVASAVRKLINKKEITSIDIHIPIMRKSIKNKIMGELIKEINKSKQIRFIQKSNLSIEATKVCIQKLKYIAEINGLIGGFNNNEKRQDA